MVLAGSAATADRVPHFGAARGGTLASSHWCAAAEVKRLLKPCPTLVDDVFAADQGAADRDV